MFANVISGRGAWTVRYAEYGKPSFCIVLEGGCRLAIDGYAPFAIGAGDFILLPTTPAFTLASHDPPQPVLRDPHALPSDGSEVRYGER
ncbi:cupin domain-containing protein [Luteimonas sp. MJ250]|uniref:cupin domain-containing protein n=1 Tax=Luteimonas sp. MJ250 TaxID=3129236 RepID=UPI0031BAB94E